MLDKLIIYVCSPLRGDIEGNISKAINYCRFVYNSGGLPLAPHTIFTQFLNDKVTEERTDGMEMGIQLLKRCDELWIFGEKISEGMKVEMDVAKSLGMNIKRFNKDCEYVGWDFDK